MLRVIITENFHVFVSQAGKTDRRVGFTKGMVVEDDKIPEGQTTDDWIAKGLAKAASMPPSVASAT